MRFFNNTADLFSGTGGGSCSDEHSQDTVGTTVAYTLIGGFFAVLAGLLYLAIAYFAVLGNALTPGCTMDNTSFMQSGVSLINRGLDRFFGKSETLGGTADIALFGIGSALQDCTTLVWLYTTYWACSPFIPQDDAAPYNRVERKAEKVYAHLSDSKKKDAFPAIIAKSGEAYGAFMPVYGGSVRAMSNNLDILEKTLEGTTKHREGRA